MANRNQGTTRWEAEPESEAVNVMYDPRIIRGNTYSAKILTNNLRESQNKMTSPVKLRKKVMSKRSNTPPPVDGRVHINIQTETFLEELSDRLIEKDAETQTHLFVDRPPSPLFIPTKTGKDVETQILPGELFLFDLEVEPILEVLVGKTIQSAMLELLQEEELDAIRRQQYEYEIIRDTELSEVKRLESELLRKHQEKERRIEQARIRLEEKQALNDKIQAKKYAIKLLADLQNELFNTLYKERYFYDSVEKEVEELYMPELLTTLCYRIECSDAVELATDEILTSVLSQLKGIEDEENKRRDEVERVRVEEEARILALAAEEEEKKRMTDLKLAEHLTAGDGAEALNPDGEGGDDPAE